MHRRSLLQIGGHLGLASLLASPLLQAGRQRADAEVVSRPTAHNHFASIGAAIAAAPDSGSQPFRIRIAPGRWYEKLIIDKPNIHLIGSGEHSTRLFHDTAAGSLQADGNPWGTWGCASVIVRAPGFRAEHLTIENAFDYVRHLYDPGFQPIGANGLQAVALMLDTGSDRSQLQQVRLIGHQDTLFVDHGRSLFRNCFISGSVDFVFGAGRSVFERCILHSRFRPDKERQGYIAAPSTARREVGGLLFDRCRLQRDAEVADGTVALGRAWRPTRSFSDGDYGDPDSVGSALYHRCWMDAHIDAVGWDAMSYTNRQSARVPLEPLQARLFESRSRGPGAARNPTRRWLDRDAPEWFDRSDLFGDWAARP